MPIRPLTASDAHSYQLLRLKAVQSDAQSFLSNLEREEKKTADQFANELEYSRFPPIFGYWGAFSEEDQNKILGYVQISSSTLPKQLHIAFIYNLYIDPQFRRQGLAYKLLNHLFYLLKEQTDIERIFLSCNAKNKNAIRFYKKIGFKRCGIKPKSIKWQDEQRQTFYDDEIEMVYVLN